MNGKVNIEESLTHSARSINTAKHYINDNVTFYLSSPPRL